MKKILSLILIFTYLVTCAQFNPMPLNLGSNSVVDTARYKIIYNLKYKNHPNDADYKADTRNVLIGRHAIADKSYIIQYFDSLRTELDKNGATSFNSITGMPWPMETVFDIESGRVDICYRLPLHKVTALRYSQIIPNLSWEHIDGNDTVIGYECNKALVEFAGRRYTAWFATELPLPYGPYKFHGLPGLILRIEDEDLQFVWEAIGIERTTTNILCYKYDGEKKCTKEDADRTIQRMFNSPLRFKESDGITTIIVGPDGKEYPSTDLQDQPLLYKAIE